MSDKLRPGYADVKSIIANGFNGNGILAEGPTVPTDATAGYAPGCWFFKRSGATGQRVYWNDGTATSCAFKPIAVTGAEMALLSGLLATGAEINRTSQVSTRMVTAITTLAVSLAAHEGRTIALSLLAGFASTLPAATGSGAIYKFVIGIVNTTGSYTIVTAGSDVYKGSLIITVPGSTYATANIGETFRSTAGTTITLTGLATGGASIGDWIEVQDIQSGVWSVKGNVTATTTPLTMFS